MEKDINTFILEKSVEKMNENWNKSPEYQEGFTAGCRFISKLIDEMESRKVTAISQN